MDFWTSLEFGLFLLSWMPGWCAIGIPNRIIGLGVLERALIRGSVEQVEREAKEIILRRTTEPTRIILESTLTIDRGKETTGDWERL